MVIANLEICLHLQVVLEPLVMVMVVEEVQWEVVVAVVPLTLMLSLTTVQLHQQVLSF
jgi:hypothetical protein